MAKVTLANLEDAVKSIFDEYGDEVTTNLDEITKRVGKAGVQALKSAASVFNGSKYRNSWKAETTKDRNGTTVTLYSTMPGLPHLLEYGHANRNGGRTPGRVHIAPVEQKLIESFEQEVQKL